MLDTSADWDHWRTRTDSATPDRSPARRTYSLGILHFDAVLLLALSSSLLLISAGNITETWKWIINILSNTMRGISAFQEIFTQIGSLDSSEQSWMLCIHSQPYWVSAPLCYFKEHTGPGGSNKISKNWNLGTSCATPKPFKEKKKKLQKLVDPLVTANPGLKVHSFQNAQSIHVVSV